MGQQPTLPRDGEVEEIALREALEERYLQYALSTITGRALPDARDGLKPVHRRLLYAMQQLRLDPGAAFKKCARVVGDVSGKFHPHGDQAVYDTRVRLAQDFAQRDPLIDGRGDVGVGDGVNPSARCERGGTRKRPDAEPTSSSSTRFRGWCRRDAWSKDLPN